ncbi:MAG TPA: GntR family transcriptional regulator [Patescibacteria group bacterium]|nr:GntR family transcriptional regulator [Patescibacteria group bacterium]
MDISLNAQIYNDLRSDIKNRVYHEGDLLPTELEIQKRYGVSRAPVRQALGRLENEGIIVRRAGKGTYVAKQQEWSYSQMGGFRKEFLEKSGDLHCTTLVLAKERAPNEVCVDLGVPLRTGMVYIERLRRYKGVPFQYLIHYSLCLPEETYRQAGDIQNMPEFYGKNGILIESIIEEIDAVAANEHLAGVLGVAAGQALLRIKKITYDQREKAIELMKYYILSEHWKYRVTFNQSGINVE